MFRDCTSSEETKSLFKKLAMRLHPDYGGSNELMILLQEAYEKTLNLIEENEEISEKFKTKNKKPKDRFYEKSYENIYLEDEDERLKILDEILEYSKSHPRFNTNFTHEMVLFLNDNLYLTSGQYNSLVKIYYCFRMDEKVK